MALSSLSPPEGPTMEQEVIEQFLAAARRYFQLSAPVGG